MTELQGNTSRMMREMAQQIRQIVEERLTPITRMRHLANQLEQYADALEMEVTATRH